MTIFELTGVDATLGNHDAVWNAEQFGVRKFDARSRIPIIEQDIESGLGELGVELFGQLRHARRLDGVERYEHDIEGRERLGPDDAGGIVVLLDRCGDDARDADAIAAHVHHERFTGFVENARLQRFTIFAPELENMSDFDTPANAECARAARTRVAGDDVAQVRRFGCGQIAQPVDATIVMIELVGAANEVGHCQSRVVDIDRAFETDRPQKSGLAACGFDDRLARGKAQGLCDLR